MKNPAGYKWRFVGYFYDTQTSPNHCTAPKHQMCRLLAAKYREGMSPRPPSLPTGSEAWCRKSHMALVQMNTPKRRGTRENCLPPFLYYATLPWYFAAGRLPSVVPSLQMIGGERLVTGSKILGLRSWLKKRWRLSSTQCWAHHIGLQRLLAYTLLRRMSSLERYVSKCQKKLSREDLEDKKVLFLQYRFDQSECFQ